MSLAAPVSPRARGLRAGAYDGAFRHPAPLLRDVEPHRIEAQRIGDGENRAWTRAAGLGGVNRESMTNR